MAKEQFEKYNNVINLLLIERASAEADGYSDIGDEREDMYCDVLDDLWYEMDDNKCRQTKYFTTAGQYVVNGGSFGD